MDLFVYIALAIGAILGLIKGAVRLLFSWGAIIVAALFANQWAAALAAQFFPGVLSNRFWLILFAIGVFAAAVCLIEFSGVLIKKAINKIRLGLFDHLAGFFLGAVFAGVILGFLFAALIHYKFIQNPSPMVMMLSDGALKTFTLIRSTLPR